MTDVQVGDKVRITTEGEVVGIDDLRRGVSVVRHPGALRSMYYRHDIDQVEVIEKRKPQVGDMVEGVEAYASLPTGTVLRGPAGSSLVRVAGGRYISAVRPENLLAAEGLHTPRELVYLP